MEDLLKCAICKMFYNCDNKKPLITNCGHTFCLNCIMVNTSKEDNHCTLCGGKNVLDVDLCFENKLVEEMVKLIPVERREKTKNTHTPTKPHVINIPKDKKIKKKSDELNKKEGVLTLSEHRSNSSSKLKDNRIDAWVYGSSENSNKNSNNPLGHYREIRPLKTTKTMTTISNNINIFNNYNQNIIVKSQMRSAEKISGRNQLKEDGANGKETNEEDLSLESIPLIDDRSVFDPSLNEDIQELLTEKTKSVNNESENEPNPSIYLSEIEKNEASSKVSASDKAENISETTKPLSSEDPLRKLKEEIYYKFSDNSFKRKKFDDNLLKASKHPLFLNKIDHLFIKIYPNEDFYIGLNEPCTINPTQAIMFYANDDYYEGEILHDKREGYGILIYKNGTRYEGMLKENKQHGYGKLVQPDGEVYIGEWKDGKINGSGVRYHSNGDRYSGNYLNNIRNGNGQYVFANGDSYEGTWVNGRANGKGVFIYSNGNSYEGEFVDNQISGKGVFKLSNGDVYKGMFKNGLINGKGMLKTSKGDKYQGEFLNGKKHGSGCLFSSDGTVICNGYWNLDVFIGKNPGHS